MSTSRHIDKICVFAVVISLVLTFLFMNGASLGIVAADRVMGYENKLFDTASVHTLDIVMNDWDSFIETCENEEYSPCSVIIDGESCKNVGIRAKGNTSLSSVKTLGSKRYSFKIEFDHYESGKSYYGLDKLSLNNLIQDNTMMKDYLVYQMMADFGADAPLCSFVYITVNGEDWGLYLAVEGVEDSFLQRNYGSDSGELYKPDSMSNGGGRGNGKDFNFEDFGDFDGSEIDSFGGKDGSHDSDSGFAAENTPHGFGNNHGSEKRPPEFGENQETKNRPAEVGENQGSENRLSETDENQETENIFPELGNNQGSENTPHEFGENHGFGNDFFGADTNSGNIPPQLPDGEEFQSGDFPEPPEAPDGSVPESPDENAPQFPKDFTKPAETGQEQTEFYSELPALPDGSAPPMSQGFNGGSERDFGFGGGRNGEMGGGMGSDDVKLKYIDDNPDSYANIFDNAKTDVSESDKQRLISSLKNLSEYTDIENTVDTDEVLRYFVVHNFVCNGDSYTGSMVHNYYLREKDGKLSMIPWDYNLAFGTFQGGNADSQVNASIDSPVSGGNSDDRPMVGWIFSDESYTEEYHRLFSEFIARWFTSGELVRLIEDTAELLRPYVEKDPTKFCTLDEFDTGTETIAEFVTLRAEAVSRQLSGDSTAVETGDLNLSDMGSMNDTMGNRGGNGGRSGK